MTMSRHGASAPRLYSAWLTTPDGGPRALRFGDDLAAALHNREVLQYRTSLADLATFPTYCYLHWVVVLEELTSVEDVGPALKQYRKSRPSGLSAVITKAVHESQAGIVQVVAPAPVLAMLRDSSIGAHLCATHDLARVQVGDVLSAAVPPLLPRGTGVSDLSTSALERLWRDVRARWNLPADISCVPHLLAVIMRCGVFYDSPSLPAMYRPLPHIQRHATKNRFDLILEPATREEVGDRMWKSYRENGATIVRGSILPAIAAAFPGAEIPTHGHRGAQRAIKDLVESLELLCAHPDCKQGSDHESRNEG